MKVSPILSLLILALTCHAANAAALSPSNYSDIDVVSVTPRSPDIKPFVMAILTKEQQRMVSAAGFKKSSFAAKDQNP